MSELVTCSESRSIQVSPSHNDTPSTVDDMIDIKYDIGGNGSNSPTDERSSCLQTEQNRPNDFDFLQCEQDCVTCQKYIRILSEHVRTTHRGHPIRDPLHIEMPYSSSSQEIKCEVEDVESMDCEAEAEIMFHTTEERNESDNVPDCNVTDVLKVSIGEKPYPCEICGKGYSRKQKLSAHVKAFHGNDEQMNQTGDKPYKCEQCGRGYTTKGYLNIHKKIHTGEGLLDCDECGKSFSTKPHLTAHKISHTGEKPYHCDECEKCFTKLNKLIIHKRSHTGERPYKCDECEKSFTRSDWLSVHKMSHTGERPYQCGLCEKSFKRSDHLTNHARTHNNIIA